MEKAGRQECKAPKMAEKYVHFDIYLFRWDLFSVAKCSLAAGSCYSSTMLRFLCCCSTQAESWWSSPAGYTLIRGWSYNLNDHFFKVCFRLCHGFIDWSARGTREEEWRAAKGPPVGLEPSAAAARTTPLYTYWAAGAAKNHDFKEKEKQIMKSVC